MAHKLLVVGGAMETPPDEPVAFAAWVRKHRETLRWSTSKLAKVAQTLAKSQGDPIVIQQQKISQIEAVAFKKNQPWFRYVAAAIDFGISTGVGTKSVEDLSRLATAHHASKDGYLIQDPSGRIVGRVVWFDEPMTATTETDS